jgi:hypothetical protein
MTVRSAEELAAGSESELLDCPEAAGAFDPVLAHPVSMSPAINAAVTARLMRRSHQAFHSYDQ